jgi:hypothetical protein
MWVKNTETGNVWDVSDEHGERLLKEGNFEKTKKPTEKNTQKDDADQKSDIDEQS